MPENGAPPIPDQCAVCVYPRRANVEAGILAGVSARAIERQERAVDPTAPSRGPIGRHAALCMPAAVRAAEDALAQPRLAIVQAVATAATERLDAVKPLVAFSDRIEALLVPVEKAHRACDRWLTDPANPAEYDIGPRAYEITVVYQDGAFPAKATLAELLARVNETAPVISVEANMADPREYLLSVNAEARKSLELIAKILGLLKTGPTVEVNLTASPAWLAIEARFSALRDARPELAAELRWLASGEGAIPVAALEGHPIP